MLIVRRLNKESICIHLPRLWISFVVTLYKKRLLQKLRLQQRTADWIIFHKEDVTHALGQFLLVWFCIYRHFQLCECKQVAFTDEQSISTLSNKLLIASVWSVLLTNSRENFQPPLGNSVEHLRDRRYFFFFSFLAMV